MGKGSDANGSQRLAVDALKEQIQLHELHKYFDNENVRHLYHLSGCQEAVYMNLKTNDIAEVPIMLAYIKREEVAHICKKLSIAPPL